ncbi:MAG: sensor histidine kinase [Paracoccaceae bacterium]
MTGSILKRLQNMPLSLRVPLIASAMMVLVGVVASQQVLSSLSSVQEARLQELARLNVDGLAVALGPSVQRRDVWEVFDTLDRATSAGSGQRMVLSVVADEAGRVIAASDPLRAPVDSDVGPLADGAQAIDAIRLSGGVDHIRVTANLDYQGRTVGLIVSELNVADLVAERWKAGIYLLAGNAVATLVLAFGGYLAMRRMLKPVARLAGHMGRMEGALEPIPASDVPKGDTELARLFQTYNAMSDAVQAKAEAERRLAERERFVSLGRLSSSLAHEINNPLGGLLNATDTIRTYADRPDVVRVAADLLDRGLRHLRDVARATLEQNRIDRSGQPLRPEDFDDLRLLFGPEVARLDQHLTWDIEAPISTLQIQSAAIVRQIVLNLLLNAASAAGPRGTVALNVTSAQNGLALRVSDSGPGLNQAARQRLLTDAPAQPGGGVGLRLVRHLVLQASGTVTYTRMTDTTEISVFLPEVDGRC